MKSDICWVCIFTLDSARLADFKAVVAPLVAETRKVVGSVAYEYRVSSDQTEIHILEHCRDPVAVVHHVTKTFSQSAEAFTAIASVRALRFLVRLMTRLQPSLMGCARHALEDQCRIPAGTPTDRALGRMGSDPQRDVWSIRPHHDRWPAGLRGNPMFSGIIEDLGTIRATTLAAGSLTLNLAIGFADLSLGESVAVNGVCLTAVSYDAEGLAQFFASKETLQRTNLGSLQAGDRVNLERAVSMATRLSGHLVQGHVDGQARLDAVSPESGAFRIDLILPKSLARYCVEKGSIALDGISLTLNAVEDLPSGECRISLTIIPHTWAHTNLQARRVGDLLNVETDVMAKYVERLCKPSL